MYWMSGLKDEYRGTYRKGEIINFMALKNHRIDAMDDVCTHFMSLRLGEADLLGRTFEDALGLTDVACAATAPPLPSTYSVNPKLSDSNWETLSLSDFGNALECSSLAHDHDVRPIHGSATWRMLRQTYEDVVGRSRSSIRRVQSAIEHGWINETVYPAQDAELLHVDYIPKRGRGIVASRDIKKGEKLWSDMYLGRWESRKTNACYSTLSLAR